MNDPSQQVFRGVVALELRDGTPPRHAALGAEAAGELTALLGRDLAALVPAVRDCDLALMGAHFDPAEALRPGWPLHRRVLELLQRAPGSADAACMVGFGADARGDVPQPLQCDAELTGGGLRVLPFALRGAAAGTAGAELEDLLLERGMAAADTALALQDGLAAQVEHARCLSLHDLLAMIALQYRNTGLDALWPLLETAVLEPDGEAWLDSPPEPLARYGDGEVRIALLDPMVWRKNFAPAGETDCTRLERGFEQFQARQRQYAAVLGAHGIPVNFVHCADGSRDPLR